MERPHHTPDCPGCLAAANQAGKVQNQIPAIKCKTKRTSVQKASHGCEIHSQWQTGVCRRRSFHPHPLDVARHTRHDRHQVRMRHGAVRRVYRALERTSHPFVHHAGFGRRRAADHHHRGTSSRQDRQGRGRCVGPQRCGPMRLLPERPDHERCRAAQEQSCTERRRHRSRHGWEYLPLWHLCAHSGGHS